jgi:hypothetical protein
MKSRLWVVGLMIGLAGACGDDAGTKADGAAGTGGSVTGGTGGGTGGTAGGTGGSAPDAAVVPDTGASDVPAVGGDAAAGDVTTSDVAAISDVAAGPDGPAAAADAAADSGITMVPLMPDDKPGITPCPGQAVLLDPAQLTALKVAMRDGVVSYLDVPFNGADANIYKKKCGFETFFNPVENTDAIPVSGAPKLAAIIATQHGGICSDGFNGGFGVDDGFPSVGAYRKEFKVAHMGATYHVRARVTAKGPAAGQKFSANGITVPGDIQNTLVYKVAGMVTPHDSLWATIANLISFDGTNFPGIDLTVDKAGNTLFQSKIELICASKM